MAALEVIALDTATPQLRAPGAGDTYTFPRQALFLAGTVGAPGIAQSSDDNTGMWWPAADTLAWSLNGSEAMRLTSTGLGIGTNNPGYKLHVNTSTANEIARFEGSAVNGGFVSFYDGTAPRLFAGFGSTLCTTAASTDGVIRYSGNLLFSRNANETARMDSSGNLGLGVTPSAWRTSEFKALQVGNGASFYGRVASGDEDKAGFSANAFFDQADNRWEYIATDSASRYDQIGGGHYWFTAASGTAGNAISFTQAMTLDASGRLLLGTTTASGALMDIQGSTSGTLQLLTIENTSTNAAAASRFTIKSPGASWHVDNLRTGGVLTFTRQSTLYLTMDNVGNIVTGSAAIATNATDGFLYVPGCAGTPTGTPTAYTGRVPIVVDTTNNKLYFYSGGQWRDAGP